MNCPKCGVKVELDSRFCTSCGNKLTQSGLGSGHRSVTIAEKIINTTLNIEQAKPSGGVYCPICGRGVKIEDSFRCQKCERSYLHISHLNRELNICVECASELMPDDAVGKPINTDLFDVHDDEMEIYLPSGKFIRLVCVQSGIFFMGSKDNGNSALEDEKPASDLYLDEFWIGESPITNLQYNDFVESTGSEFPCHWNERNTIKNIENHPVVNVSWQNSTAFCLWLSEKCGRDIRLPTEAEWEKAARGTDGRIYPWGNITPDPGLCNFNNNVGRTTPVGHYSPSGDSPYGCKDMAGNVWEWTSTKYLKYPYNPGGGRESSDYSGLRVLRGGSFRSSQDFVRCAFRSRDVPYYFSSDIGFRICLSLNTD